MQPVPPSGHLTDDITDRAAREDTRADICEQTGHVVVRGVLGPIITSAFAE